MANFYTLLAGLALTALSATFTHSLGITPASLVVRPILHNPQGTATAPIIIQTVGTNVFTAILGAGTLATFDAEVQYITSPNW